MCCVVVALLQAILLPPLKALCICIALSPLSFALSSTILHFQSNFSHPLLLSNNGAVEVQLSHSHYFRVNTTINQTTSSAPNPALINRLIFYQPGRLIVYLLVDRRQLRRSRDLSPITLISLSPAR